MKNIFIFYILSKWRMFFRVLIEITEYVPIYNDFTRHFSRSTNGITIRVTHTKEKQSSIGINLFGHKKVYDLSELEI